MSEKTVTVRAYPGFWALLTLMFVAAKIVGYINWSWWLVFALLFVPFAILAVFMAIGLSLMLVGALLK